MQPTNLTFTKGVDGKFRASFASTGTKTLIQVNRAEEAPLYIEISADGGAHYAVHTPPVAYKDQVLEVNVAEGATVTVVSLSMPTYAAYIASDNEAYTKDEMDAMLAEKQDTLVDSGTGQNVKTINNQSILGTGNIIIDGGDHKVQSDWEQDDTEADDYIKHKPTIPVVNDGTLTIQRNGTTLDTFKANASQDKTVNITVPTTAQDVNAIPSTQKGVSGGVAELDGNGKVPAAQLPSYVDDVIEGYLHNGAFYADAQHTTPITAESGKIYINKATNKQYRWSGSAYAEISESLALGETASTAYAGNKGKANADAIAAMKDGQSIDSFGDVETALADKISKSQTAGFVKNDGSIDTNTYLREQDMRTVNHESLTEDGDANLHDGTYYPNAVRDFDGNWYGAVIIGDQVILAENLRTTHYADGTPIAFGTEEYSGEPRYYFPPGGEAKKAELGLLYNWYAFTRGAAKSDTNPSGIQGIAPDGWHVPSRAEYEQLLTYLGNQARYVLEDTDTYVAKAIAAAGKWESSNNANTPGNSQDGNNAAGFGAVPAGYRMMGSYYRAGYLAEFLTTSELNGGGAAFNVNHSDKEASWTNTSQYIGCSARCICNLTPVQFRDWYVRTYGSPQHLLPKDIGEDWIVRETASGDTSVSVDIDSKAERVRLLVNNTANGSAVNVSVDGDFVAVFSESNALTVAANTAAIIEMKRVKTDNIQYPYFVCTATQVYESFTNRTYAIGELDREEVAMCVADSNDNGTIKLIPYKYFDPLTLDTTRYTLKDFVRFHRGKNGREVVMHKLETSGMWAAWNRYRVHCDTTDAGGFTWSVTINGTAKGGTVTWAAGDTLDSIVTQLNADAVSTYLVFSHESGEDFIRVRKGGYSYSVFTVTNATGTTLEDLSIYTKVGDVQQAETHRDWQTQDVVTLFPNSGYVPANARQYSVSGYNLSYMCGGNEPRYKAVYRTEGSSTYLQEDDVSSRMTEAAFNAMNGSGVEAQQQLYDKYNGSWEAYMDASMAAIDDTHTNGIEYQSYDNGDTQTAFIASVTTMDFDGSYIPAYPVGYNCWSYTDTGIVGGHFHLATLHENLVFMRSAKMAQLNAAMAFLSSYVPLTNNSKYYWTGARYNSSNAWLYVYDDGSSNGVTLYYDLYARLLAYLN